MDLTEALEGDNPYPALRAHIKAGVHDKTYEVDGNTICEGCGEILSGPRVDKPVTEEQGVNA